MEHDVESGFVADFRNEPVYGKVRACLAQASCQLVVGRLRAQRPWRPI